MPEQTGNLQILPAEPRHARDLARLINLAGEGLPELLWQDMAEGAQTALDVGEQRAGRDSGGFSYTNARVCTRNGGVLGMLLAYRQPDPYQLDDLDDYPAAVQPLAQLEALAPGSYYLNALATFPQYRGQGVATLLLRDAAALARAADCKLLSLIVASPNAAALGLYRQLGFTEQATLPVVPWPTYNHGGDWLLMTRTIE